MQEGAGSRPSNLGETEALSRAGWGQWLRSRSTVARNHIPAPTEQQRLHSLRCLPRRPPRSPESQRSPKTTIASACSAGLQGGRSRAPNSCIVRWAATSSRCGWGPIAPGCSGARSRVGTGRRNPSEWHLGEFGCPSVGDRLPSLPAGSFSSCVAWLS